MEKSRSPFIKSLLQSPWTIGTVAVRALGSVAVMKIVAVYFGSAGVALFSHFQNLIGLITQIPEQGMNLGIIRHLNEFESNKQKVLIGTSFILNVIIFLLISLLLVFYSDFFLKYFDSFISTPIYLWLLLGCIFFVLLNSIAFSVIYAKQAFKLLFGITIANYGIIVFSVYRGVLSEELQTAMLFFVVGWALYSVINFSVLLVNKTIPGFSFKTDPKVTRLIFEFLLVALISVMLGKWIDYFVRDFAINWYGIVETGYWQAQVRISESYRSVFLGTLGVIFYSQISRMDGSSEEFKTYVKRIIRLALLLTLGGLVIVWLLREPIILILFQEELIPAADFIEYQLLADIFALPAYLLIYLLIRDKNWGFFITIHIVSALIYLLGISSVIGFANLGIESIPLANLIRFAMIFLILVIAQNKRFK